MIKAIILAVLSATNVPFMAKHRNVAPETVVTTNFFGSVTGIVDNAYIAAHGGGGGGIGGLDTNAVIRLAGSGFFTNGLAASYIRQSNNCRDYNSFCGPTHFIGGIHTWNTNVVKFTKSDGGPTSTLKPDGTPVLTKGSVETTNTVNDIINSHGFVTMTNGDPSVDGKIGIIISNKPFMSPFWIKHWAVDYAKNAEESTYANSSGSATISTAIASRDYSGAPINATLILEPDCQNFGRRPVCRSHISGNTWRTNDVAFVDDIQSIVDSSVANATNALPKNIIQDGTNYVYANRDVYERKRIYPVVGVYNEDELESFPNMTSAWAYYNDGASWDNMVSNLSLRIVSEPSLDVIIPSNVVAELRWKGCWIDGVWHEGERGPVQYPTVTGAVIEESGGPYVLFAFSEDNLELIRIVTTPYVANAKIGKLALTNDIPISTISSLVQTTGSHEETISGWETYWRGDRVRLSVTNYYGNTSGESPRLRIEEFDHSTTNGTVVSNFYHVVWDEIDRQTNYMAQTDAKVSGISNAVMDAAWRQTNLQLVNKAPRAWQSVTSAGEDAPPNTVWHTAPQSVFAGGTEYAHVAVGEGTICVLTDKGAPVYTDGAEGQFRFQDQSGQNYFGFDVRSAYKIGCRTDGISVNPQQHIVSLTYDLTSATNPSILHSTNLVDWADAVVEWEQNPPEGTKVCYINCGNDPKGFYQAEIRYAGGSKFLTNMQADLMGGIAASNHTLNVIQSVEPYIISNQVMWRVKQ